MAPSSSDNRESDERSLRVFCRTAESASSHSANAKNAMKSKVSMAFTATATTVAVDVGDLDYAKGLLTLLRQLLLEKDVQSFNKVANIIAKRLPDGSGLRNDSAHNRAEWKRALNTPKAGIHDKDGRKFSPKEMFDLVAYSGTIHTGSPELERWDELDEITQGMVLAQVTILLKRLTAIAMAQRTVILDAFNEGAFNWDYLG